MVNFVEQATLIVKDKATPTLKKINKAIVSLRREASRPITVDLRIRGFENLRSQAESVASVLRRLPRVKTIRLQIEGAERARSELSRLGRVRTARMNVDLVGNANAMSVLRRLGTQRASNITVNMVGYTEALQKLTRLTRVRKARIDIDLRGYAAALARLNTLTAPRAAVISTVPAATTGPRRAAAVRAPRAQAAPLAGLSFAETGRIIGQTAGERMASSFTSSLSPRNFGRQIVRGMVFGLASEVYSGVRTTIVAGATAPLTLETAQFNVRTAGFDEADLARLTTLANDLSAVYTSLTPASILSNSAEVAAGVGDDPAAQAASLGRLAETASRLMKTQGLTAEDATDQARLLEKVVTIRGLQDDFGAGSSLIDTLIRAMISSGGDLTANEIVRATQQGGQLKFQMSDQAFAQMLNARDEGGRMSTGEFRMTMNALTRGSLNKDDKERMAQFGLRDADFSPNASANEFANNPMDFVNSRIIPILLGLGVDINNAVDVASALDNEIGFTSTSARLITAFVTQRADIARGITRSEAVDLAYADDNTTTATEGRAVAAQFQSLAANALLGFSKDVVGPSLTALSGAMNNLNQGDQTTKDYVAIGASAIPLALYAALSGIGNAETRPMALSSLALTGSAGALDVSAAALTGAATALTGAAAAGGGVDRLGRGRGRGRGGVGSTLLAGAAIYSATGFLSPSVVGSVNNSGQTAVRAVGGNETDQDFGGIVAELAAVGVVLKGWGAVATAIGILPTAILSAVIVGTGYAAYDALTTTEAELASTAAFRKAESDATLNVARLMRENNDVLMRMDGTFRNANGGIVSAPIAEALRYLVRNETVQTGGDLEGLEAIYAPPNIKDLRFDREELNRTFNLGEQAFTPLLDSMSETANSAGPIIGEGLLQMAPQIGVAIGEAAATVISGSRVNLPEGQDEVPSLDTGATIPQ